MQNWRHYLSKTRVKIKKNWHDHWEWLNKPFQNASKPWEWFRRKEIGCRTNWSREILNSVCLLVNSCLKGKDGRNFCIALWLGTKNGFITIISSVENHSRGEFPAMLPRRRPNRIFTAPRLCIWWDQLDVVYYELLKPTETITGDRYRTQLMRLSRALKDKRPQYNERHDKVILQHARPHVAKVIKTYLETLKWEVLPQWHTTWLTSTSGLMKK